MRKATRKIPGVEDVIERVVKCSTKPQPFPLPIGLAALSCRRSGWGEGARQGG